MYCVTKHLNQVKSTTYSSRLITNYTDTLDTVSEPIRSGQDQIEAVTVEHLITPCHRESTARCYTLFGVARIRPKSPYITSQWDARLRVVLKVPYYTNITMHTNKSCIRPYIEISYICICCLPTWLPAGLLFSMIAYLSASRVKMTIRFTEMKLNKINRALGHLCAHIG